MENKDYTQDINGAERRFITFETRMDDEGKIEGIASKVNDTYDLGWFEERVAPGAFDGVLKDDVRVLFNHDPNQIVARTSAGTAELFLNKSGDLGYRYETPNTSIGKDLEENIRLGNVSQSSFAFSIDAEEWEQRDGDKDLRTITKFKRLYDVSPVTYPASPSTEVAKRSHEKLEKPNADITAEPETEVKITYKNKYRRKLKLTKQKEK